MAKIDIGKLNEAVEKAFDRIFEEEEKEMKPDQWHDDYSNKEENNVIQTRINPDTKKPEFKIPTNDKVYDTRDAAIAALKEGKGKSKNNLKEDKNTMDRKPTIGMVEERLRNFVDEAVKRVLNESKNMFIIVELPGNVAEDDNVLSTIREAMGQIGYEYYDNHSGGYNGDSWIYRYAPRQAPVGVQMY